MSVIAFVPARLGSKSILEKNIKSFCGKPLVFWNLQQLEASIVDQIIVSTDSDKIQKIVESFNFSKVKIYRRSIENASDFASTESVMLEYINSRNLGGDDIFMLVQITSPFTRSLHFNQGLELFNQYDSVLSCCVSKKFIWSKDGFALNYDIYNRPRRQDYQGDLIENGAFYISLVKNIKKSKNRISGNIGIYKMPEYTAIEIDQKEDWSIAESLMKSFVLNPFSIDFSKIKIFLSDVDGVLTDGGMYYTENGDEIKKFSTYDGMSFYLLQKAGVKVGIITTEDKELNRRRAQKLNLDFDFHGIKDKLKTVKQLCSEQSISLEEIAYIGDDINCLELLSNVGIAACPSNAVREIKNIPGIIKLKKMGGEGVLREFIEIVLENYEFLEKY